MELKNTVAGGKGPRLVAKERNFEYERAGLLKPWNFGFKPARAGGPTAKLRIGKGRSGGKLHTKKTRKGKRK